MKKEINETIERELRELTVDYPDADAINQTIFALYEYVPEQKKSLKDWIGQLKELIILSGKEFVHISPYFWIANFIFLFFGIVSISFFYANPLLTLFTLSPIPFLTGLLEIFKSRDQEMIELKATLKYTATQLLFSRMFIVAGFNFILNVMMLAWLFESVNITLHLTQFLIYWIMPVAVTSAIGLVITTRVKGTSASPILLSSWLLIGFFISQFPSFLTSISKAGSISVIIASLCIIILQLKKIKGENFIESNC